MRTPAQVQWADQAEVLHDQLCCACYCSSRAKPPQRFNDGPAPWQLWCGGQCLQSFSGPFPSNALPQAEGSFASRCSLVRSPPEGQDGIGVQAKDEVVCLKGKTAFGKWPSKQAILDCKSVTAAGMTVKDHILNSACREPPPPLFAPRGRLLSHIEEGVASPSQLYITDDHKRAPDNVKTDGSPLEDQVRQNGRRSCERGRQGES